MMGVTWSTADAVADSIADNRPRGMAPDVDGVMFDYMYMYVNDMSMSTECWSWVAKLTYVHVLCTSWRDEVNPKDVIAALPAPDVLEDYVRCTLHLRTGFVNVFLLAAQVCEKLEQHSDALLFVAKALRYEPSGSTDARERTDDARPTTHGAANALHGRVLATLGRTEEAEAAFEEAVLVSHKHGLWLLEMFALRDLKKHILDTDGRGDEGTERLKGVLKEMKGPPAELTKLLGAGLDAEEILHS